MEFIYFGQKFSSAATAGNFSSFTCVTSQSGVEWDDIQAVLDGGRSVYVRQPTAEEAETMEQLLTYFRNTGKPATTLEAIYRTYH
jgi:hypothetical protein